MVAHAGRSKKQESQEFAMRRQRNNATVHVACKCVCVIDIGVGGMNE